MSDPLSTLGQQWRSADRIAASTTSPFISGDRIMREAIHYLMSRPITLHWMGWQTDTARLFKNGWEISVDQDIQNNGMRIAIQKKPEPHEHNGIQYQGITMMDRFRYEEYRRREQEFSRFDLPIYNMRMAHQIFESYMIPNGMMDHNFHAVNAEPFYTNAEVRALEDLAHFRKLERHEDTHQIWLQQANLDEVLGVALSKQEDKQAEIRHNMLQREAMEKYNRESIPKAELRLVI